MRRENSLRIKLGLSQQQMADYLGVDRSLLAHYEAGKRDLPTDALLKLSYLELNVIQLEKGKVAVDDIANERKTQAKDKLEKYAKKCLAEVDILENKLAHLKEKEALNSFQSMVFQAMLAKLDKNNKKYEFDKLLIEIWIEDINGNKVEFEIIPILEIRIKVLQLQAEMAKTYFD